MPAQSIALVLVAAFAHAGWNLASKYKRGDTVAFVWVYTCASALLWLPVALWTMLRSPVQIDARLLIACLLSAALHVGYSLVLQAGYDRADLGVVYPVARGTGPLLTMLVAVAVLGERIGVVAALGAVTVLVGVAVVASRPRGPSGPHRHRGRGVVWGAITGVFIAGYTVWDAHAVTAWQLPPTTYYAGTLLIQCLVLTPVALRRRHTIPAVLRSDLRPVLVIAVLSPLAYILVLVAMTTAPVALVAPLRESSIVVGSLLAWRLFDEGHPARRLAGAGLVVAGIVAISL